MCESGLAVVTAINQRECNEMNCIVTHLPSAEIVRDDNPIAIRVYIFPTNQQARTMAAIVQRDFPLQAVLDSVDAAEHPNVGDMVFTGPLAPTCLAEPMRRVIPIKVLALRIEDLLSFQMCANCVHHRHLELNIVTLTAMFSDIASVARM